MQVSSPPAVPLGSANPPFPVPTKFNGVVVPGDTLPVLGFAPKLMKAKNDAAASRSKLRNIRGSENPFCDKELVRMDVAFRAENADAGTSVEVTGLASYS